MTRANFEASSARVRQWETLTGVDFAEMDRANTIAVVACSPLEVHGPHLPVITDYLEAEGLALRTMERINEVRPDLSFVQLPPLYVAADVVPKPGSVAFRSETVLQVLEDLGRTLAKQGFQHIWVTSFHGGPRHFVPLEAACDRVSKRYNVSMVSLFSMLLGELTGGKGELKEVLQGVTGFGGDTLVEDLHGGAIETSMMLALMGENVSPVFKSLPRNTPTLWLKARGQKAYDPGEKPSPLALIRRMIDKFQFFTEETYGGDPASASAEAGEEIMDILSGYARDALLELLEGRKTVEECRSPLWPLRWLFMYRAPGAVFERLMRFQNPIW